MTHIYCSNKLEPFIGKVEPLPKDLPDNHFGSWNGHVFSIERRKNLIFTNDKTAYSFLLLDVVKKDIKDFRAVFREHLIQQLENDLHINEAQENNLRRELNEIKIHPTNNNKRIAGVINECVLSLKLHAELKGGLSQLYDVIHGQYLNSGLSKAKLELNKDQYFHPKDLMRDLLA